MCISVFNRAIATCLALHVDARGHGRPRAGSEGHVFARAKVGAGRAFGSVGRQLTFSAHAYL